MGGTPEIALFHTGYLAVEFFFLVSGYLMAKSAEKRANVGCSEIGKETLWFLWNKMKPILPVWLFAAVFSYGVKCFTQNYTLYQGVYNLLIGIWDLSFLRLFGVYSIDIVRPGWYLSAMFIAMAILYPLVRRFKQTFTHLIAPLCSLFILGYLSKTYGNLNLYTQNDGLIMPGLLRAIAEVSLGCVCYEFSKIIKKIDLTLAGRITVTLIQLIGYSGIIYCMNAVKSGQFDFVILPALVVCVTLSFSGQGALSSPVSQGRIASWLGKFSLVLYLNHMWVKDLLVEILPAEMGYHRLLAICLFCVFIVSSVYLLLEKYSLWFWGKYRHRISRLFIKSSTRQECQ